MFLKLCCCPSFLHGRKCVYFISSVLVCVNAIRFRDDTVAVTRHFCLITWNANYPEMMREGEIKARKWWD